MLLNLPLKVFEPFNDIELAGIAEMPFPGKTVLICLANIQSTLLPVFSTLMQPGKITLLEIKSPQWLLVLV